jgi:tetratricopeptide (TPR) repeat protein
LGLLALVLIGFISAVGGYRSGIVQRQGAERTQVAQAADEQFSLGVQDLQQGQYARARQRFEYVVQLNPSYPGVTEKLAEVYLALNTTATPTLVPTPTLTPTPDLRNVQELYDQGKQFLLNGDWTNTIETLLMLRKVDPNFQAIDVDGMLFLALRNRGSDKILKQADLEGGIYDLSLANRYGPLDAEAQGLLNWASLYITGASFWGIDWEQAVNYFSQVAPQLPNLMDGSKMTATERYRVALFEYGNTLARQGHACKAVGVYQQSLAIAQNPDVQQAMEAAAKVCSGQEAGPQATKTKKPRGTPSP